MRYWQVIKSVLAALFGVQSQQNYEVDFTSKGLFMPILIVGFIMVLLFIAVLVFVINYFVI